MYSEFVLSIIDLLNIAIRDLGGDAGIQMNKIKDTQHHTVNNSCRHTMKYFEEFISTHMVLFRNKDFFRYRVCMVRRP